MSNSWTALSMLLGSLLLVLLVVGRSSRNDAAKRSAAESLAGAGLAGHSTDADATAANAAAPVAKKDDKKTAAAKSWDEYPLQDNPLAGCSLCHVDIEDQFLGSIHFEEKIGCKTCHGPSEGHVADENNEVKPEEVFAREDVDRLCGRCHECFREIPAEPELAADGKPKVCIDCHGAHDVALAASSDP